MPLQQDIAHEVRPAATPYGAENCGYGGLDPLVGVGNGQPDAFQAATLWPSGPPVEL